MREGRASLTAMDVPFQTRSLRQGRDEKKQGNCRGGSPRIAYEYVSSGPTIHYPILLVPGTDVFVQPRVVSWCPAHKDFSHQSVTAILLSLTRC